MIQKNQRSIICAHLNSTINHSGSHGWGHHFNHGNIQSCSLQGRGAVVRRADPRVERVEDRSVSQGGVETIAQNRYLRSLPLDHKPCLGHGPCPAPMGWRGGGGDEAGDSRCCVVWAVAWSRKDKEYLPRRRAASLHTECGVGTALSLLQGHDQLCIQRERWNEASQDSGGLR